jgi:hypothetical protein
MLNTRFYLDVEYHITFSSFVSIKYKTLKLKKLMEVEKILINTQFLVYTFKLTMNLNYLSINKTTSCHFFS